MTLLDSCIFCKIIKGTIPCNKIIETAKVLAFMDISPLSEGHVLVVPKFHGERLHDVPEEYLEDILPTARKIARVAFGESKIDYNILQNNGRLANQAVDHVHFHIIPKRNPEEGLKIKWDPISTSQEDLAKFAEQVRNKL